MLKITDILKLLGLYLSMDSVDVILNINFISKLLELYLSMGHTVVMFKINFAVKFFRTVLIYKQYRSYIENYLCIEHLGTAIIYEQFCLWENCNKKLSEGMQVITIFTVLCVGSRICWNHPVKTSEKSGRKVVQVWH